MRSQVEGRGVAQYDLEVFYPLTFIKYKNLLQ